MTQELKHYGVKGMKWGKRRARANEIYNQNKDKTNYVAGLNESGKLTITTKTFSPRIKRKAAMRIAKGKNENWRTALDNAQLKDDLIKSAITVTGVVSAMAGATILAEKAIGR